MEDVADEIIRLGALCGRRPSPPPRDWSELPTDILYQVMCHLPSLRRRLSLAAVCRHWHAAVRLTLPSALPKLCLALPLPYLRFFTFRRRCSGLKLHRNCPKSSHHGDYRGASSSQLLFATDSSRGGVYSLVNPFTGRARPLPVTSGILLHEDEPAPAHEDGYWSEEMPVRKLVVCPDGLVAAILGDERSAKVALCAPEWAWSWSLAGGPWRWYADMVFFDGKLYALTNDEDLLALDVGYDDVSGEPRITHVQCVIDGGGGTRYTLQQYSRMRYLVVRPNGRGLLMVCRVMLEHGWTTYQFLLFQADFQSSHWVEVDTLGGDEALFVGRQCSRAVRAARHGVRGDQIFFLDDSAGMEGSPLRDDLANVYDMKDGRVSELLRMEPRAHNYEEVPATWLFREDADAEDY